MATMETMATSCNRIENEIASENEDRNDLVLIYHHESANDTRTHNNSPHNDETLPSTPPIHRKKSNASDHSSDNDSEEDQNLFLPNPNATAKATAATRLTLTSTQQYLARLMNQNGKRTSRRHHRAEKRVRCFTPKRRPKPSFERVFQQYLENTKMIAMDVELNGITRKLKLLALNQLSDGPYMLTQVNYYKEIGEGKGPILDFVSECFGELVTKYGVSLHDHYLPPSNDIVANNDQMQQTLFNCGCLMQIGLLLGVENGTSDIQLANWHPMVYLACFHASLNQTTEEIMRNLTDRIYEDANSIVLDHKKEICEIKQDLSRLHCHELLEEKCQNSSSADIPEEFIRDCTFHVIYVSRSLAYKHIHRGFTHNNRRAHCAFDMMDSNEIYDSFSKLQSRKQVYAGEDIRNKVQFIDASRINTNVKVAFLHAIEMLNQNDARKLVSLWTGSAMVRSTTQLL